MVRPLTNDELFGLLDAARETGTRVMLVGEPGIGKTKKIERYSKERGRHQKVLIGSQLYANDIAGLPEAHEDPETRRRVVSYVMTKLQNDILENPETDWLLDELSCTPPDVLAPIMRIINEGVFPNGDKVPKETFIIAATNTTEQSVDGYEMGIPLYNRFMVIPMQVNIEEWQKGIRDNWGDISSVSQEELTMRNTIADFIGLHNAYLQRVPKPEDDFSSDSAKMSYYIADEISEDVAKHTWPSCRTWEILARMLGKMGTDNEDVTSLITCGLVGVRAGLAFCDYLKSHKKITVKPEDVLANFDAVNWKKATPETVFVLLSGIVDSVSIGNYLKIRDLLVHIANEGCSDLGSRFVGSYLENVSKKVGQSACFDVVADLLEAYPEASLANKAEH